MSIPIIAEDIDSSHLTHQDMAVVQEIINEFVRAQRFHDFNSEHEGYAVLKEEVDELWDAIKNNKHSSTEDRVAEAIQVAAMGMKYVTSLRHKGRV